MLRESREFELMNGPQRQPYLVAVSLMQESACPAWRQYPAGHIDFAPSTRSRWYLEARMCALCQR